MISSWHATGWVEKENLLSSDASLAILCDARQLNFFCATLRYKHLGSHDICLLEHKTCSYALNAIRFQIHLRFIVTAEIIMITTWTRRMNENRKCTEKSSSKDSRNHQESDKQAIDFSGNFVVDSFGGR